MEIKLSGWAQAALIGLSIAVALAKQTTTPKPPAPVVWSSLAGAETLTRDQEKSP